MKMVEQFKRRILDLAIRGKLVPQDPNDESASVLLERIREERAELVKTGKIKKDKQPSRIVIGSDGAAYEKFGEDEGRKAHTEGRKHGEACGSGDCLAQSRRGRRAEVPFDLPNGWAWCRVSDATVLKRGKYITRNQIHHGTIPVILGGQEPAYYCDKSNHEGPCVVVSRSGASAGFASYWDEPIFVTDGFLFECMGDIDTRYLYFWLKSFPLGRMQRGTGIPHVRAEALNSLLFPLPPLAEQKRIVAKIEELFAVAGALGTAAEGLGNAARRLDRKILDLAIRGKLVPQNPDDEPVSELLKRMSASSHKSPCKNQSEPIDPPFVIPQSWEWVRLNELGVFCGGHTPSTSNPKLWGGDILWVSSKDMKSKYIDDTQIKVTRLGAEELNVLKPGTLLMCTRSGILRRVFPVAIARRELTINQDQRALTLWLPEMIEYVYLTLKSLEPIILSDYKKSGTTVESIIWNKFVDLPIPLPPLNEQKRIVKRVEELKATTRTLVTF